MNSSSPIPRRLKLLVPLPSAQDRIREQIKRGERLRDTRIHTKSALTKAEAEKERWTNFNIELLRQILSSPEYSNQYQKFHSAFSNPSNSLGDEIGLLQAEVDEQTNQLKSDLERLSLIAEATPEHTGPTGTPKATIHNVFHSSVGNVAQHSHGIEQVVNSTNQKSRISKEGRIALIALFVAVLSAIAAWLSVPGLLK